MNSRSPIRIDSYIVRFDDGTKCLVHISDLRQGELEEGDESGTGSLQVVTQRSTAGMRDTPESASGRYRRRAGRQSQLDQDVRVGHRQRLGDLHLAPGSGSQFLHEKIPRRQCDFDLKFPETDRPCGYDEVYGRKEPNADFLPH